MFTDEDYMKMALQEAQYALEKNEVPVGAIVVHNNTKKIIARTHNLTEMLNDVTAHAEIQAISSAAEALGGKYLIGCTLYITLEPCLMCAGALFWSQISKVVIGARDEQRGFINKNINLHPKTEIITGILKDECAEIIKKFFQEKR